MTPKVSDFHFEIYKWKPAECGARTDAYVKAIQAAIDQPEGQGLFNLTAGDLAESNATLIGAFADAEGGPVFAGALHAVFDGLEQQWLQGAIVVPEFRGHRLLTICAAHARLFASPHNGAAATSLCVVRVFPDDTVNEASRRSFIAAGLDTEIGRNRTPIAGTYRDRHLVRTAEADGTFRSLTLRGGTQSLGIAEAIVRGVRT